ncbi:MAG TPA: hypothetical protein VG897_12800 [Terriglobales bacterium]|nr:hypothetical protein [Terriglobales bacterium]
MAAIVTMVMLLSGHFASSGPLSAAGFGGFSSNLLSPLVPQFSGLFPSVANWMLDATGGQYEGFAYLGGGLLSLFLAAVPRLGRILICQWHRHACLAITLILLSLFAFSNELYVGQRHVLTVPLPAVVLNLAGIFRSSGRFVWPMLYCVMALTIVSVVSLHRRAAAGLLVASALVQWIDVAPLRAKFAASIAEAAPTMINQVSWQSAIAQHSYVRILPSFGCQVPGNPPNWSSRLTVTIILLAATKNVPINSVFADRSRWQCNQETQSPVAAILMPGELRVYLGEYGPFDSLLAQSAAICSTSARIMVCSRDQSAGERRPLLVVRDGVDGAVHPTLARELP